MCVYADMSVCVCVDMNNPRCGGWLDAWRDGCGEREREYH